MLDVAYALLADTADWTDRLTAMCGGEPVNARQNLHEHFAPLPADADVFDGGDETETNVVELASFVSAVNRGLR